MENIWDRNGANSLQIIDSIEKGLSYSVLGNLAKQFGLAFNDLREIIGISERTLIRRKQENKLTKSESDRLVSVGRMLKQASELFENDNLKARQWLYSANRALGGRTPIELAQTETGLREVENLIIRLEHGVFS